MASSVDRERVFYMAYEPVKRFLTDVCGVLDIKTDILDSDKCALQPLIYKDGKSYIILKVVYSKGKNAATAFGQLDEKLKNGIGVLFYSIRTVFSTLVRQINAENQNALSLLSLDFNESDNAFFANVTDHLLIKRLNLTMELKGLLEHRTQYGDEKFRTEFSKASSALEEVEQLIKKENVCNRLASVNSQLRKLTLTVKMSRKKQIPDKYKSNIKIDGPSYADV